MQFDGIFYFRKYLEFFFTTVKKLGNPTKFYVREFIKRSCHSNKFTILNLVEMKIKFQFDLTCSLPKPCFPSVFQLPAPINFSNSP